MYKQAPPFSIQVELTEGCNRGCNFCGLRGMRKHGKAPFYFMKKETAERISDEIARVGWKSRIIFSMHGEPTLNKNHERIISLFRRKLPNAVFSIMTNGFGIAQSTDISKKIESLKHAGLNDLIIDMYEPGDDGYKIFEYVKKHHIDHEVLAKKVPLYSSNPRKFRILFNPPIQLKEGSAINRHLCNHCGAAAPLDFSYKDKRCARPFREMTFRYEGSVALCCNDFRGEYPIGNIMFSNIDDLWQNKRFKAARIMLYAGERLFTPCLGCNALSHRVGLLPDLLGKETLPEPTDKVRSYCRSVTKNTDPLCGSNWNKRPWENHTKEVH